MAQPPLFGYRGVGLKRDSTSIDDMFDIFFHDGAFDDDFGAFETEDFLGENDQEQEGIDYEENEKEERGQKNQTSKSDIDKSERR